jgi:uncharacterized membrane protein YbhN (UPF0104 family)
MIKWLQRLQPLFLVLAFGLIFLLLRGQWDELRRQQWRLHGGWLAFSGLCMAGSWAVEVWVWQQLLRHMGGHLAYAAAWRVWFLGAIVRYVPGNIWQPLSMALHCRRLGIRPEATLSSVALYQVISLLAVAPIATIYFPLAGRSDAVASTLRSAAPGLAVLLLLPVLLFLLKPGWLLASLNWMLRKAGRPTLEARVARRDLALLLAAAVANWLLWGVAFAALVFALRSYAVQRIVQLAPHLIMVYSIAYGVGVVSLVTPSGFGVREGAFYLLLSPLLDGGSVTLAALAMRVWNMIGEASLAALSLLKWETTAYTHAPPAPYAGRVEVE